ncbi:hypothetical protein [Clostridium sp. BNL1100]|uniref:hypothetical protein n=1 Tax=Clostridium sp. BNL1100 TaxID=755731 RepID=UPI00024A71BA|nr:hypothetical protein [Clostridium sp. BNL1100]AEY67202.1 hypothetical protein Clo1100_3054 [Clostridium sp. BNL1100]
MKLHFTDIFEVLNQKDEFYLINKKLDTIIKINEPLYTVLKDLEQGKELKDNTLKIDILNILISNRVLEVVN